MDKSGIRRGRGPYGVLVRWDALFADLGSQLGLAQARERLDDVPDLTRAERAGIRLVDRLRAHSGPLRLVLADGEALGGVVADAGPQWLLVLADDGREHLVPLGALAAVSGLGDAAAPPAGVVLSRLTLGHALRAVARDRSLVRVRTTGGAVVGRVDAVGADHLDVALVRADSGRPTGERRAVPWSALLALCRL